jgi:hypothetical protein
MADQPGEGIGYGIEVIDAPEKRAQYREIVGAQEILRGHDVERAAPCPIHDGLGARVDGRPLASDCPAIPPPRQDSGKYSALGRST